MAFESYGAFVGNGAIVASTMGGGGAGGGDALAGDATPASGVGEGVSSGAGEPTPATVFKPSVARAIVGANASGVIKNVTAGNFVRTTIARLGINGLTSGTIGDGAVTEIDAARF